MDPRQALGYPHFVSLALVVAASTLVAGNWAERRRGHDSTRGRSPCSLLAGLALVFALMLVYCFFCYLLSASVVVVILWAVFGLPYTTPDVAMAEAVAELATLFSVASNFADVASTYGRPNFWKHLRQYVVFVLPVYYATMVFAWAGAQALALKIHYEPFHAARAWRLFTLPTLTLVPMLNFVLFVTLFFAAGAVSYRLRKRGEER